MSYDKSYAHLRYKWQFDYNRLHILLQVHSIVGEILNGKQLLILQD